MDQFDIIWEELVTALKPGLEIMHWNPYNGYLDEKSTVIACQPDFISIDAWTPPPGFTNNPNCVTFNKDDLVPGETYEPIDFWDEPSTDVDSDRMAIVPNRFSLRQNYPNPFNPSTNITFTLPRNSRVTIDVYNVHGSKITTLVEGIKTAGMHTAQWNGKDASGNSVPAGVYVCKMKATGFEQTIRMLLLK